MKTKHILSMMLALVMIASVFVPVVSADDQVGIGLDATIKEPVPDIAISVDVEHIGFGELSPGETSASHPVNVTNVGTAEIDVTAEAFDAEEQEEIFGPGLLINGAVWREYSATLVADAEDEFAVALHVPETVTATGHIGGSLVVYAEKHAAGTTVLYDDTVELTAGDTFGFTSSNGTVYTDLNVTTDLGALYATGLDLEVSGEWYEQYGTFFLESIDGIANKPWPGYSWALYINGTYADVGLYGNPVVTGSNVKLYYLVYDDNFNPLIDEALYLVNIDVVVNGPPVEDLTAAFSTNDRSGQAEYTVQFTDESVGAPTSWTWDFGDHTIGYGPNPSHVYKFPGKFTVTLTVSNDAGSDVKTETDYIAVSANTAVSEPTAQFTSNRPASGFTAPTRAVTFTDQSTGATAWFWQFGDGTTSTEKSPTHTYTVLPGDLVSESDVYFTVTLTVYNAGGSSTEPKTNYIRAIIPFADPVIFVDAISGLKVTFGDGSSNMVPKLAPLQWTWNFGDGTDPLVYTTFQSSVVHTYAVASTYTVTLTVSNAYTFSTHTTQVQVTVPG